MAEHGTAFFAHEQTAGKGQMGREWIAEKGANIALSIVLNPQPLQLSQQFWLSASIALATLHFLRPYAGDELCIKWPNDVYWQDRKMGGILIESIITTGQIWQWAVAGIGINVNQSSFPAHLPNPVSLKQLTGKSFSTIELAKNLAQHIIDCFDRLIKHGFNEIYREYNEELYKIGQPVKLKKNNKVFQTTIKGVSETGELITHNSVFEERFTFGEISWII
jgi:BirA family biotin operon repressor/biotin-[acetyl-CoA-carboxylase] ligase